MQTLNSPISRPDLTVVEIVSSNADALNNTMRVGLSYGYYDAVAEEYKYERHESHTFSGQDYTDIVSSTDPEATILSKLGISVV